MVVDFGNAAIFSFFISKTLSSIPIRDKILLLCSLFHRYIHRELVVKDVVPPSCLPIYLLDWVDVNSNLCVYTAMQRLKFPHAHLVADGWYLDCSRGFVPDVEQGLYNILVGSAPEVIEFKEEPEEDIPAPLSIEKEVVPVKGKGKGRKLVPHSSSQVSTCSLHQGIRSTQCSCHYRSWQSKRHSFGPCPPSRSSSFS